MLGGVQKGGTTALAQFLSAHPGIRLPSMKEAHVFDAALFEDGMSAQAVDAMFASKFARGFDQAPGILHGDATPISIFHPAFVDRIARYNPAMRWILILRDPSTRAISHYFMERGRGNEHLSLPMALLAERWRLKGHERDFSPNSPLRRHSYIARGRYVRQLDALHSRFPKDQILLIRNQDLREAPQDTLDTVFDFLDAPPLKEGAVYPEVFSGDWQRSRTARLVRPWLQRLFASEVRELGRRYGVHLVE